jgi:lysozyme
MKSISKRGENLIHSFEGLRLEAYQDEAGVWTIGWGHTGPCARKGNKITPQRADELFDQDNDAAEAVVNRLDKLRGPDNGLTVLQFDALVSFEFNTGALSNRKNTITRYVIECKDDDVDDQMLRWVNITDPKTGKKRPSNGLKRRRHAEAQLWVEGCKAPVLAGFRPAEVSSTPEPVAPPTPAKEAAASPAVQGSAVATASAVLATATEQIQPLAGYSDTLRIVFVLLALAGVGLAIYGAVKGRK